VFDESFYAEAENMLRTRARGVLHQFLLDSHEGRWHPNGFAVFNLGELEGLGRLRLHVWPRGLRIALEGQPAIHSHPWDLCSLVIAGCYTDTLYRAQEFDSDGPGRLRGFHLRFGSGREGDELCPVPLWYELTVTDKRAIMIGQLHQMAAGVLHESPIPHDAFVATLLIASQVVDLGKLLLVGDGNFGKRLYTRPPVSVKQLRDMKTALWNALSGMV
jgi:hypothetical protein